MGISHFLKRVIKAGDLEKAADYEFDQYINLRSDGFDEKESMLGLSIQNKHFALTKYMLEKGAEANDLYAIKAACEMGDLQFIKLLETHGASLFTESLAAGRIPLEHACQYGSINIVGYIIFNAPALDLSKQENNSALLKAFASNQLEIVNFLIDQGINTDLSESNLLSSTIQTGNLELIRLALELLEKKTFIGDDLDLIRYLEREKDFDFKTAVQSGNLMATRYFVEEKGEPVSIPKESLETVIPPDRYYRVEQDAPLYWALRAKNPQVLKFLLDQGAEYPIKNRILITAIIRKNISALKLLVARGEDASETYNYIDGAFFYLPLPESGEGEHRVSLIQVAKNFSSEQGEQTEALIYFLSEHGANPNEAISHAIYKDKFDFIKELVKDKNINLTCLSDAALSFASIEAFRFLEELMPSIDYQNLIDHAVRQSNLPLVEYLQAKGHAPSNEIDLMEAVWSGVCPKLLRQLLKRSLPLVTLNKMLIGAVQRGCMETMQLLFELGAQINPDDKEESPLVTAIKYSNYRVFQCLVDAGAKIEADPKKGSPLMEALKKGNLPIVESLIRAGSDIFTRDRDRNTLLHITAAIGNLALFKRLEQAGLDIAAKNKEGMALCSD